MTQTIAIVACLDTKGQEVAFMKSELEQLGGKALVMDVGVLGDPTTAFDISKEEVVTKGGGKLQNLLKNPSREVANSYMQKGSLAILSQLLREGKIHGVISLGGTQGTSLASAIFQSLPYGFPKLILSTVASGDVAPFIGIKDITMMFSVSDILGLNVFSERILSNAILAVWGMAHSQQNIQKSKAKGVIGLSNLGVLTKGAMHAISLFEKAGYEVITFHAIGAGGEAMEEMMREGIITGVFEYALGEISDAEFKCLRAGKDSRLTVAGELNIPQVICPGGSEHLGILVSEANKIPDGYENHQITWHTPFVFVPRLNQAEQDRVAQNISRRLEKIKDPSKALFLMPRKGVSSYSVQGGELYNQSLTDGYWESLQKHLPSKLPKEALDYAAEEPQFVEYAVEKLIQLMETNNA